MADKSNAESINLTRLYSLLLSLKDEVSRLNVQLKAMRNEMKGVTENGKKI
ncbi:MAG: hypothetical protein IKL10_06805 [Clostridia bacterium]|nr:hypothetical protein [Clostridia bacterium]